jgi:hypothetical protein
LCGFKKSKYLVPLANRKNNFSEEIARFICKTKLPDISRGKACGKLIGQWARLKLEIQKKV